MTGPCRALEAKFRRLVVVMSSPALGVFLLTYTFMASMGADPFNCMETAQCDAAAEPETVMRSEPSITCTNLLGCDPAYCGYAMLGTLVLSFCALIMVAIWLFLNARQETLFKDEKTMTAFGSLYMRYTKDAFYWEVVILVRKLSFVLVGALLSYEPWLQVGFCGAIIAAALALQKWKKPFASDDHLGG